MLINAINTGISYKSATVNQSEGRRNRADREDVADTTVKNETNYKKMGALAVGLAVVVAAVLKHKSIGNFLKKFTKSAENGKNGGSPVAEDWNPNAKGKKNPMKPVIDENGNILGYRNTMFDKNIKFDTYEEIA